MQCLHYHRICLNNYGGPAGAELCTPTAHRWFRTVNPCLVSGTTHQVIIKAKDATALTLQIIVNNYVSLPKVIHFIT